MKIRERSENFHFQEGRVALLGGEGVILRRLLTLCILWCRKGQLGDGGFHSGGVAYFNT